MAVQKFDTKVQYLKYKVLREVARHEWKGTLVENLRQIPKQISPGKIPTMRCCVYKERAILSERIRIAVSHNYKKQRAIEVIDIACDECPMGGYDVSPACRGCLAHRCSDVCKRGAISFDNQQKAHIDKSKCVECGACAKVCPYSAITDNIRPCERACKVKAISMDENKAAMIDYDKCIACGACVYTCPWGAIMDRSFIVDVIEMIQTSMENTKFKVYAVVAPSIASQFTYAKLGQVVTGLKELGFHSVIEAAWAADIVAYDEAAELVQKGMITSSCCPAFVQYIETKFPKMVPYISHNLSPMATMGKHLKEKEPDCKVVFIGPCTAKKEELQKDSVRHFVDSVITFEELQALFDSKDIDISTLPEAPLEDASYYGRIFARSGGLSEAAAQAAKEHGVDFEVKPVVCSGIDECRVALLKAERNMLGGNFLEGMACQGGCLNGAGCLTHGGDKSRAEIDRYSSEAKDKTIKESYRKWDKEK